MHLQFLCLRALLRYISTRKACVRLFEEPDSFSEFGACCSAHIPLTQRNCSNRQDKLITRNIFEDIASRTGEHGAVNILIRFISAQDQNLGATRFFRSRSTVCTPPDPAFEDPGLYIRLKF